MSSKREREYQRRRHEKWLEHQRRLEARSRRSRLIGRWVLAGAVLVAVALIVVTVIRTLSPPTPTTVPSPGTTTTPTSGASSAPDPAVAPDRARTVALNTSAGDVTLQLDGHAAPRAVAAVATLENGAPGRALGPIGSVPAGPVQPAGTVAMEQSQNAVDSMGSQFVLE